MESVLKLAALVVAELMRGNAGGRFGPRGAIAILCAALAGIAAFAAAGSLVAALWLYVAAWQGQVAAALVTAGALLALCILLFVIGGALWQRPRGAPAAALLDYLRRLDTDKLVREHKREVLIGAMVLGLILGRSRPARGEKPREP
jgi:hypothetical protein